MIPHTRGPISAGDAAAWSTWLALLLVILFGVLRYGRNIPLATDWSLVEPVTGNSADFSGWLWSQELDNRAPLPRLVLSGVVALARDFRAGGVLAAVATGIAAAALLLSLRRLRGGRARIADAFLALLMLGPAHWILLGWSRALEPALTSALGAMLLVAIVSDPTLRRRGWGVAAGLMLVMLPLCGTAGAVLALSAVPWIAACGRRHWPPREPDVPLETGPGLLLVALLVLTISLVYFARFDAAAFGAASTTSLTALAHSALGADGPIVPVLGGLLLASAVVLIRGYIRVGGVERYRAFGMICFGVGAMLAVLAMGWSTVWRGGDAGIPVGGRLLAVPLFAAVYFAWELYAPPLVAMLCETALLGLMLLRTPDHLRAARAHRAGYARMMASFAADLNGRLPADSMGVRYGVPVARGDGVRLAERIRMLQRDGFGPFSARRARGRPSPP